MYKRKTVVFVTHSTEEAVQLSDRVIVISPRPGTIARDLAIDLPRPRTLEVCEYLQSTLCRRYRRTPPATG